MCTVRMRTIQDLRKVAELNLCNDCFLKYKAVIEPTIKQWLFKPLSDWRVVESYATQMAMKIKGVFKGQLIFLSLDEGDDEKYADEVDAKAFRKIKKWNLKQKIDFLHKNGVLQDSSYRFLNKVREVRNRIHDEFAELSEQDFTLFYMASAITSQIYMATMHNLGENTSTNLKSNAEKVAEQLLLKIAK